MPAIPFHPRLSIEQVEVGSELEPEFDADGLVPCVTADATSHGVLMLGRMNAEALRRTLQTGEGHCFSRSSGDLAQGRNIRSCPDARRGADR